VNGCVADMDVADSAVEPWQCDTGEQHLQCRTQAPQTHCSAQKPRPSPGIHAAPHGSNVRALPQSAAPWVQRPRAASAYAPGSDSSTATPDASAQPQPGGSAQPGAPAQGVADSSVLACATASASSHARGRPGMLECACAASVARASCTHDFQRGLTAIATRQASCSAEDDFWLIKGKSNAASTQATAGERAARLPCTHAGQSVADAQSSPVLPGHAALTDIPAAAPALLALTEMDSERDRERQEAVLPCADRRDSTDMPKSPRCSSDHG